MEVEEGARVAVVQAAAEEAEAEAADVLELARDEVLATGADGQQLRATNPGPGAQMAPHGARCQGACAVAAGGRRGAGSQADCEAGLAAAQLHGMHPHTGLRGLAFTMGRSAQWPAGSSCGGDGAESLTRGRWCGRGMLGRGPTGLCSRKNVGVTVSRHSTQSGLPHLDLPVPQSSTKGSTPISPVSLQPPSTMAERTQLPAPIVKRVTFAANLVPPLFRIPDGRFALHLLAPPRA